MKILIEVASSFTRIICGLDVVQSQITKTRTGSQMESCLKIPTLLTLRRF